MIQLRHPVAHISLLALSLTLSGTRATTARSAFAPLGPNYGMTVAPVTLQSIGVIKFASDGILYVADSRAGAIYGIDVGDQVRDTSTSGIAVSAIDEQIATLLGVPASEIRIRDMAAHPTSQSLYFSVTRGQGPAAQPLIVRLTKADKRLSVVDLSNVRHARAAIPDAASSDTTQPWERVSRSLTITDLAPTDGELYIAGLSNEEFRSALRRIPLPFDGTSKTTLVEVYHTSHDRFETAAPIEAMTALTLRGQPVVLASYTCAPLAVFERQALRQQAQVRGRTVAELGGGNRPLDMITYTSPRDGKPYVLIANSHRTLMRFDVEEIAAAPAMTTSVKRAYQPGGVAYLPVSSYGVLQLDRFNRQNVVVLQRDPVDGSLDISTQGLGWL